MLPTAYMTARDTTRSAERGGDGFESDMMKTARDMHTARGFETDDYMSAAEHSGSGGTGIFFKVVNSVFLIIFHVYSISIQ